MVLAVAWAIYLVPKVLRHHDEIARTRSVDRFSNAMRVLARREPVDRRTARLVVTPPRTVQRVVPPTRTDADEAAATEVPYVPARWAGRRAAARAAARRRRHVLLSLLVLDVVVVALAVFAVLAWWTAAAPVALTVAYLMLCRTQVRRENDASWTTTTTTTTTRPTTVAPRRAIRVGAASGTPLTPAVAVEAEFSDEEDTVQFPLEACETVAVAVETADGGSLWDPLPVTLPTYVGKARAARTVRTIDLAAPDTWSSGRDEADSALVEQSTAEAEQAEGAGATQEAPRAVGS